jgi:hypothetical protein
MRNANGGANAALEAKGQKVGALRFSNLDVRQLRGLTAANVYSLAQLSSVSQVVEVDASKPINGRKDKYEMAGPQIPQPEKIGVSATVQCAFQIL